jgi:hypothetical protein
MPHLTIKGATEENLTFYSVLKKASIYKSMCSLETSKEFSTTAYTFRPDIKPVFY